MSLVEIGRNEPCPCGSGKKYKKCCLNEVQSKEYTVARALQGIMNLPQASQLTKALSLVLGLKPNEEEAIPEEGALISAAERVFQNDSGDSHMETHDRLAELLKLKGLRQVRFRYSRIREVLARKDFLKRYDEEREPAPAEVDELLIDTVRSLVTEDLREELLWTLLWQLRDPDASQNDYEALIWGLWLALKRDDVNPLWITLFNLTIKETAAAQERIEEIRKISKEDSLENGQAAVQLVKVFEEYPAYERNLSQELAAAVKPALEAILEERIHLKVPLYTVINGAVDMVNHLLGVIAQNAADPASLHDKANQALATKKGGFWETIHQDIWERDYDLFAPVVREQLQSWLDERQESGTDLSESVEELLSAFGSSVLSAEIKIFETIYLMCLGGVFLPEHSLELMSHSKLESLANELSEEGNEAGAESLREALKRLKSPEEVLAFRNPQG